MSIKLFLINTAIITLTIAAIVFKAFGLDTYCIIAYRTFCVVMVLLLGVFAKIFHDATLRVERESLKTSTYTYTVLRSDKVAAVLLCITYVILIFK